MRIDITLICRYSKSWSLVGWGTPSYCALGCHVYDNVDLNFGAPSYIDVLDYIGALDWDAMVGLIETLGLEEPMIPWFVELKASQIVSDDNRYIGANPIGIMTSHSFYNCKLFFILIFHVW